MNSEEHIEPLENKAGKPDLKDIISREKKIIEEIKKRKKVVKSSFPNVSGLYDDADLFRISGLKPPEKSAVTNLQTLERLLEQDKKREEDGFPRRIKLGKYIKPSKDNKGQVVIVPTTTEPKFYHDDSVTEDGEGQTGGAGEGEEGEVIGEQQAEPEGQEGEGQGPGQGQGTGHDLSQEAFDLGKVLTEKFNLPNLKDKGRKRAFAKYTYDLTDKNRGFGQIIDKKATLKKIIETNIMLGRLKAGDIINPEELIINPRDQIYRIMSREKDFETQAVVFFLRDYSGSMQGNATEVITTQHLLIYSWLMFQYQTNVITRFILHDTEAKEVPDFYTYHHSLVAGGTNIAPAFELVNKIVVEEQLAREYNIYVFHGTDGDDWSEDGKEMIDACKIMIGYVNRIGITIAKNAWSADTNTIYERYMEESGLLKEKPDLIKLDSFESDNASENRIIEGIKKLVS